MTFRKLTWLWGLLVAQAGCAAFFLFDALADWVGQDAALGFRHYHSFEMLVALALVAGFIATALQIRDLLHQQSDLNRQVRIAKGSLAKLIEHQFTEWGLSAAERDVAMLAIKGLSISEMAEIRQTREGTIKAQCAAVYRKAGVAGRLQLISLFIEDLIADPLIDDRTE